MRLCAGLVASPGGMAPHDMELELERLVGGVLDGLSADAVTEAAAAPDDSGMAAASRPEPVANGRRTTSVQFLHGHSIRLKCRHFAVRRRRGKRKGKSRRGAGEWPAQDRLGIVADASPALCDAVTRACLSETCDSAVRTLACRGIGMSVTRAQRISRAIGSRSLGLRDRRLAAAATAAEEQRALREAGEDAGPAPAGLWGDLGGTDIAVAIDGGRMSIRTARPGRMAADRSRHGHHTDWREPKLHIIYEVGRDGRLQRGGRQLAGGILGSPDGLAALPAADLRRIGAASARRVVFLGDGAVWIRRRVDAIAEAAGITAVKCARCLDFCHAVRHPAVFAEHAGFRDTCERVRWLDGMRRLMMTGTADAVIGVVS